MVSWSNDKRIRTFGRANFRWLAAQIRFDDTTPFARHARYINFSTARNNGIKMFVQFACAKP